MRSLIILIFIILAPQTVLANFTKYKCYWIATDGSISDGIIFFLLEDTKDVTYGFSDLTSTKYQTSEDGNLIGWVNVNQKGIESFIFDKRVSTIFRSFFMISDAYKGKMPNSWFEQKCSQQ